MKKLLPPLLLLILTACGGPLNKSVFEPLTLEELSAINKKDTMFVTLYEYIEAVRNEILVTDVQRVPYSGLNYKRVYDLAFFPRDTVKTKKLFDKYEKEWSDEYGHYLPKVDSVSTYWKNIVEEQGPQNFVEVELAELDKEYYRYFGGVQNINLGFRLTPLHGKVEKLEFGYTIVPKEKNRIFIWDFEYTDCQTSVSFDTPVLRYWAVDYSDRKILEPLTIETLENEYDVRIKLKKVRVDGVEHSFEQLGVPGSLTSYWQYESSEYEILKDMYVQDIVEEVFDEKYIDKEDFCWQKLQEYLETKDPLAYKFLDISLNDDQYPGP